MTEEEAEFLEYEFSDGKGNRRYNKEVAFAMIGAGLSLTHLLVGWEISRTVYFGWMRMPAGGKRANRIGPTIGIDPREF
ncbi:hypothetical protein Sa4125_04800 [Aureimonas sp. SA4125]|nr:hypothetical protein Sa4125_04800 [Aureimonas sp. SA4125]